MERGDDVVSGSEPGGTARADVQVRRFRHIVLWPLQILPTREGRPVKLEALQRQLGADRWRLANHAFENARDAFDERHYREFVTFLPHVQRILYGNTRDATEPLSDSEALLKTYRRSDVAAVRMVLGLGLTPVTCRVARLDLHFFHEVPAVILACEIVASDLPLATAQDIIYRFGRAYPPGWTAEGEPVHCPIKTEWLDADGRVLAASDYEKRTAYFDFVARRRTPRIVSHWAYASDPLQSNATGSGELQYRPIQYYRMPAMTYLQFDRVADLSREDFIRLTFAASPRRPGEAPYSERAFRNFETRYCYDLLYDKRSSALAQNTRFLSCGKAFTVVTEGNSPEPTDDERGVLGRFCNQYFLLFLLSHFHRASMLLLSDRLVATIQRLDPASPKSVSEFRRRVYRGQEAFLRFTQRYWFTELSDQTQARDLFHLQIGHLRNEALYNILRTEIFDMVQYLDSDLLRRQSSSMHRLTVVTILGLIGTIATGYLGINLIAWADSPLLDKIMFFFTTLGVVVALAFLTIALSGRLTRLFDWMSGERP